jgi:hypothetical protein
MPNLTNKNHSMLLDLGKQEISALTSELNIEVNKVHLDSTEEELKATFEKLEETLSRLTSKCQQFRSIATK